MKITKRQLRRIIKEEKARLLSERSYVNRAQELRDQVRDERDALEVEAADLIGRLALPTDDAVMNDGSSYEPKLEQMLEQITVVRNALEALVKLGY
jgi:DNA repair ATPase RecN